MLIRWYWQSAVVARFVPVYNIKRLDMWFLIGRLISGILRVDLAIAPIIIGGRPAMKQPMAAMYDRYMALFSVLAESTRWKYTCHGMPPNISTSIRSMYCAMSIFSTVPSHLSFVSIMLSTAGFVRANGIHRIYHYYNKFTIWFNKLIYFRFLFPLTD